MNRFDTSKSMESNVYIASPTNTCRGKPAYFSSVSPETMIGMKCKKKKSAVLVASQEPSTCAIPPPLSQERIGTFSKLCLCT